MDRIKNEKEFEKVCEELEEVIDAKEGTKEYDELMRLADLIEEYEKRTLYGEENSSAGKADDR